MKVGDLVIHAHHASALSAPSRTGIIIERGVFVGRRDIKVVWDDGKIFTANSKNFEVISESR